MTRPAALSLALLLAACSDPHRPIDEPPDGGCEPTAPPLALECPAAIDLGCIDGAASLDEPGVTVSSCDDEPRAPSLRCTPDLGAPFAAGETPVHCEASLGEHTARCDFVVSARQRGGFGLRCPGPTTLECAGPVTPYAVPSPEVLEDCGAMVGAMSSDAPAGGFPPGDTTVTFAASGEAGFSTSCETTVSVVDTTPPALECGGSRTLVLTEPAGALAVSPIEALDGCDGSVLTTPTPATLGPGTTLVTHVAVDAAGHEATCAEEITVLEGYAVEDLRILSGSRGPGGATSITLGWTPAPAAHATGYRVERGAGPGGPWTTLHEADLDEVLFVDEEVPSPGAWYRIVTEIGGADGGVAGPIRAHAIAATGYDLRGQRVATVPFATTLYGVVRHPVSLDDGPYPLVLLLHGNHGNCRPVPFVFDDQCSETTDHDCHWWGHETTPNAEGLAYLAETLAAQGYVAASLSANALNCREDYIIQRAELILEHLRRWAAWSTTGGAPFGEDFAGAVDLERVGLVGHSRGGEAVAHVPARLRATPIAGVTLASVFSIAPTDYHTPTPSGVPYGVLLGGCDGDVVPLLGMHIHDRAITTADPVERGQVFFPRANHNFFSTEWRYDDNGWAAICPIAAEAGDVAQQGMLEATLSAWFDATVRGAPLERSLRADGPTPDCVDAWAQQDLDLRWSHSAAHRVVIDDLTGPAAPEVNLLGEPNAFEGFTQARACFQDLCDGSFPHALDALLLSWDGDLPIAAFHLGGLDASDASALSFRVTSRWSRLNDGIDEQEFVIRVIDTGGTAAELLLSSVQPVPHLYETAEIREVLQTVRVRIEDLLALEPTLDVSSLDRLELEMTVPGHGAGSVILTNLELAR